ncbi:40106_t:CDS:2, partial [Gigaspora margarita]
WIRDIVQGNTDWADVKAAILQSAKPKYNVETKIECLMNLKLNKDEIGKESADQTDLDVDRLANIFSELKICQISQKSKVEKDIKRIDRLEFSISKLTKLVKNIANNKN